MFFHPRVGSLTFKLHILSWNHMKTCTIAHKFAHNSTGNSEVTLCSYRNQPTLKVNYLARFHTSHIQKLTHLCQRSNSFAVGTDVAFQVQIVQNNLWCDQSKSVRSRKYWLEPNKAENVFCFLLFLASFKCLYLWNQLTNLNKVFCKCTCENGAYS